MREFFREIVHALEAGQPAELVSVAASEGSTPRGAGAMPVSWNRPRVLLYWANSRSPWSTCTSTEG